VREVLLTGRGSQLRRVRRAVAVQAKNLNASAKALTLADPDDLKRAVAGGCMLVPRSHFVEGALPTSTLGGTLRVISGRSVFGEFVAGTPIEGGQRMLVSMKLDEPPRNVLDYVVREYRIHTDPT